MWKGKHFGNTVFKIAETRGGGVEGGRERFGVNPINKSVKRSSVCKELITDEERGQRFQLLLGYK